MNHKISINIGTHGRDADKFRRMVKQAAGAQNISMSQFCLEAVETRAKKTIALESKRQTPYMLSLHESQEGT